MLPPRPAPAPRARLLGRPGGRGGGRPRRRPTGWGRFRAREGATRGTRRSAPGLATNRERSVNDLIARLGLWNWDRPSLAPPPPWSAPHRGHKTAPLPGPRPGEPPCGPGRRR